MLSYGKQNPIAIGKAHIFIGQVDRNGTSFPTFILPPSENQEYF
jgi:hypothetical protein